LVWFWCEWRGWCHHYNYLVGIIFCLFDNQKGIQIKTEKKIVLNERLLNEFKYAGLVFLTTGFITFLYTADMVFVEHYFPSEKAGFYGGIATIARIVFFVSGSVGTVLISSVKLGVDYRENIKILKKSLGLVSLIGLFLVTFFIFAPELAIKLMVGEQYLDYGYLLVEMSLLLFLVSVVNLLVMFFLALRKFFLMRVSLVGIMIPSILSLFRHNQMKDIVENFLIGAVLVAVFLFSFAMVLSRKNPKKSY